MKHATFGLMVALVAACGSSPGSNTGPEVCTDGIDNDGDGAIDCTDNDCAADPACAAGAEVCDDQIDNDGNGDIDCTDAACDSDPGCDPANFGEFAEIDDVTLNELSGGCGLPNPFPDFDLSPGGVFFPTFGANNDVFFVFGAGSTNPATATNLTILGGAGDNCSLNLSSFGTPKRFALNVHCSSTGGGSCDHSYNTP